MMRRLLLALFAAVVAFANATVAGAGAPPGPRGRSAFEAGAEHPALLAATRPDARIGRPPEGRRLTGAALGLGPATLAPSALALERPGLASVLAALRAGDSPGHCLCSPRSSRGPPRRP
jgi:hypothetical protein